MCKTILFVGVLLGIAAAVVAVSIQDESIKVENILQMNPRLYALGTVEGKTFMMENVTSYNWSGARTFCAGLGMQLATITSSAQYSFMLSKFTILGGKYYWTAGRDALLEDQFVWDSQSSVRVVRYGSAFSAGAVRSALALYCNSATSCYYSNYGISTTNFVLCQIA